MGCEKHMEKLYVDCVEELCPLTATNRCSTSHGAHCIHTAAMDGLKMTVSHVTISYVDSIFQPSVVVHLLSSTQQAEAGGGQPGQHSEL